MLHGPVQGGHPVDLLLIDLGAAGQKRFHDARVLRVLNCVSQGRVGSNRHGCKQACKQNPVH